MAGDLPEEKMRELCFYAEERVRNNVPIEAICRGLVSKGLSPEDAKAMVMHFRNLVHKRRTSNAKANMIIGAFWSVGGLVATIASYRSTVPGGLYGIFWRAMVFGTLEFIYGYHMHSSR